MGKPKKVLFTSHTANFHKFNRPFMRMLKEQGYTVHYASAGEEKVYDTDKHFDVPFERSPFKPGNIKAYFKLKKIIDREKYDLIHTHTPMGSVVTRLAARAARKKGTRVIYTAHGFHFFKGAPLLNWIVYYPIEKYMARHTDTLITINNEDYERAKVKFKTDVKYVPGVGVDYTKFYAVEWKLRSEQRQKIGVQDNEFVLVYVAELNKNKNQVVLLNITKRLADEGVPVKLFLIGRGDLTKTYKKRARTLGIFDRVQFMGYRGDVHELLRYADVCVATSSREGLGLNLIEAAASGLPVIASKNRGHISIIGDSINQWNMLFSVDDLEDCMQNLREIYKNIYNFRQGRPKDSLELNRYDVVEIKRVMKDVYRGDNS